MKADSSSVEVAAESDSVLDYALFPTIEYFNTAKKFELCHKVFSENAYDDGQPVACKILDCFLEKDGTSHNCIGCNIAESISIIRRFLEDFEKHDNVQQNFTIYFLLLYLLVERIEAVFEIIQLPQPYKDKHFKTFSQVKKWANFIKHPKAFILTHHAQYYYEGAGITYPKEATIINSDFVHKYYRGTKNPDEQKKLNKELYETLRNKKDVFVEFPDIAILTKNFCWSLNKFVSLIINNEVYSEVLQDEATISNYFINEKEDVQIGLSFV